MTSLLATPPASPDPHATPAVDPHLPWECRDFWQRSFLAVLPTAIESQGWKLGDQLIMTGRQKIDLLAAGWADDALAAYLSRFPLAPVAPPADCPLSP
jgi:hypothetical protein